MPAQTAPQEALRSARARQPTHSSKPQEDGRPPRRGGKRRGAPALGFCGVSEGLTLDEYVGAASTEHHVSTPGPVAAQVAAARRAVAAEAPVAAEAAVGAAAAVQGGERRPKSNKSVRFRPARPAASCRATTSRRTPDPSKIWAMPPPRKFDYEWRFNAAREVLVHKASTSTPGPAPSRRRRPPRS